MESPDTNASSPDFSELPDVTWVRIFRFLPLRDRAKVARTCRLLNEVFNHPSLWYSQKLSFMGEMHNFSRKKQNVFCTPFYVELTKRFGKYFQDLTIKIDGHFRSIPTDLQEILEQVANRCRLETLTIEAGTITSAFHERYGFPPNYSAVKALSRFVQKAFRMKHLHIRSWPMYNKMDTEDCNIFKVLALNEKLRETLETLTIFWLEEQDWSERKPILFSGSPTDIIQVLDSFKYLTTIGLRTPMITNELLQMLASKERSKLQLLKIVVHYLDPERQPLFAVPSIQPSTWQSLIKRNPDFRVECTIFLNTPNLELSNMLTPEVPLSVLSYMKYSKIDPLTLTKLYTQYKDTLTKFHSYCDSYNIDNDLLVMAQQCTNLTEIIYHGELRSGTVVAIATSRGNALKRFDVKEDKIKVPTAYDDVDEDDVLARGPDGQLVLVGLMKFHAPEDQRQEVLQTMASEVSNTLGTSWKPLK
ncbi:F-box/LRR-repeat protein 3-like [Mercenaria mercenaria]|uniref:F-box/LRR-repeat protein 3-like n=1 Tax=Mercenaria mercenaria TaxID=6596 RepID=UPI00234E406D|nr:F-box/LRR-repeat protein 3-like [Mercenaria mercenaria]XP_045205183.2 F-box/LRR-repeat protein 3-like [Mercenaria mercenaria]